MKNILVNENSEIDVLKDVKLKESDGNFGEDDSNIDLEFLYSYTKKSEINKKEITKQLTTSDGYINKIHSIIPI
ncbi:MAG: hypothetical protein HC932_01445 [Thermales bacterium]|nr:hypothetical protein [Thermales bacterium]